MCPHYNRETEAQRPPAPCTRSHWPVAEPRNASGSVLPTPALLSHFRMFPIPLEQPRLSLGLQGGNQEAGHSEEEKGVARGGSCH